MKQPPTHRVLPTGRGSSRASPVPSFGGVLGALHKVRPRVTELLQSTILPHGQDQTNSPAFPQALPHTKVGTDLLGPIFWQNHVPQDNSDYTLNTTFTAPSHHTPHPAPFCLRTTYGGDGHETSPTATEARDQVALRAEHKARTHRKCGLKCLIRGFAGLGFFPSPHQPVSKRTEFTYQNCLFVGKS